ncbi:hypothetical protein EON62_04155, partial [archaeon]
PTSRAKYFTKPVAGGGGAAAGSGVGSDKVFVTPFLQLIGTSGASIMSLDANPYVLEHAAICAAQLISVDCSDTHATPALLAWIMTHVKKYGSADPKQVKVTEVAVTALRSLLRHDFLQKVFVEEGGVEALTVMLNARNTQLLYDVVFCLWSVSLNAAYVPMLESANTVHAVCRLARVTMPLKVLRVSLALLAVRRDVACCVLPPSTCACACAHARSYLRPCTSAATPPPTTFACVRLVRACRMLPSTPRTRRRWQTFVSRTCRKLWRRWPRRSPS